MAESLAAFGRTMEAVTKEFDGSTGLARLKRVAEASRRDVDRAVRADIGDQSMSGWKRGRPIDIHGVVKVSGSEVAIQTSAQGPMRVLQSGRNQGNAGGMAGPGVSADGSTRRTKSGGVRKVRARKSKRWNGYTLGKNTWTDAVDTMTEHVPKLMAKEVHAALAKHLTGG